MKALITGASSGIGRDIARNCGCGSSGTQNGPHHV